MAGEGGGDAVLGHQPLPAVGTGVVAVQAGVGHRAPWHLGHSIVPLTPTLFSVDVLTCLSSRKTASQQSLHMAGT